MPHFTAVALGAAGAVGLAIFSMSQPGGGPPAGPLAVQLGYTPEACAAAGLSPAETSDALSALASAGTLRDQHTAARAAVDEAMTLVSRKRDLVRQGLVDDETQAELAAAEAALVSARAELEDAREILWTILVAGCTDAEREKLLNYQASGGYDVPAAYRVLGFSDSGWVEVAAAWRQQKRVEAGVFDAEDADLSAIATLPENDLVLAAESALAANLQATRQVFSGY